MGSGPHQQLILEASLVQVDANFATVYIHDPPSSMNESNLMVFPSSDDPNVTLFIWARGIILMLQRLRMLSNPEEVMTSLTSLMESDMCNHASSMKLILWSMALQKLQDAHVGRQVKVKLTMYSLSM